MLKQIYLAKLAADISWSEKPTKASLLTQSECSHSWQAICQHRLICSDETNKDKPTKNNQQQLYTKPRDIQPAVKPGCQTTCTLTLLVDWTRSGYGNKATSMHQILCAGQGEDDLGIMLLSYQL